MARYIDIHPGAVAVTEEGFRRSFRSRRSIEATEGVRFERSFFDPESGKQFCVCTAPSKEACSACTSVPESPPRRSTRSPWRRGDEPVGPCAAPPTPEKQGREK